MKPEELDSLIEVFEEKGFLTVRECRSLSSRIFLRKLEQLLNVHYGYDALEESPINTIGTFKHVDTYAIYDRNETEYNFIKDLVDSIASDPDKLWVLLSIR